MESKTKPSLLNDIDNIVLSRRKVKSKNDGSEGNSVILRLSKGNVNLAYHVFFK